MRILLDTHIFLWAISDNPKLLKSARDMIIQAMNLSNLLLLMNN